jgi:hypothetical protein
MKKLLLAFTFALWPSLAWAQCTGVFPPNTLCGNLSGSPAPPSAFSSSGSILGPGSSTDRAIVTWNGTGGALLRDNPTATIDGTTGGSFVQQPGNSGTINVNGTDWTYNEIVINADNANPGTGNGHSTYGLFIENNISGTSAHGQKYAMRGVADLGVGPTGGTTGDVVGLSGWGISNMPNGGTGGTPLGTLYGLEGIAHGFSGATNYLVVGGGEIDAIIDSGASAKHRWGWSLVSNSAVQGSTSDAALEIATTTPGTGWHYGILFDNFHGFPPISTSGCLICSDGTTNTITTGIDFGTYTITGLIFNFANLTVTGAGSYTANGILSSAGVYSTGTNGLGFKVGTGSGGAVTQTISRTTGVTLNKPTGAITLVSAAGSGSLTTFTVSNSVVVATDVIQVSQQSGTDKYATFVSNVTANSFNISFLDQSGTTTEQPVFNFVVIKGSTS